MRGAEFLSWYKLVLIFRLSCFIMGQNFSRWAFPRLQESQILQNFSDILVNFAFLIRILQVQESQTLQICYYVEHFLQDSDNIFAKNAFFS